MDKDPTLTRDLPEQLSEPTMLTGTRERGARKAKRQIYLEVLEPLKTWHSKSASVFFHKVKMCPIK